MPPVEARAGEASGVTPSREAWREAVIESITQETPTVRSFRLRPRVWRPFLAGQHVDVRLTAPDGYTAQRSYSVTSSPDDAGVLELAIERLDDGEVSPYFHEVAQAGDVIEVRGPFATHFAWRPEPDEPVLLVAGGSGVAPFMSMVRHRARLPVAPPMTLVYSARTWDDVIYREELLRHERRQDGLSVIVCLTRPAPGVTDAAGVPLEPGEGAVTVPGGPGEGWGAPAIRRADFGRRVDRAILAEAVDRLCAPLRLAFVCGRNSFVDTVSTELLALDVAPDDIRTERYGGS